ncbi:uncharacterized protein LOC142363815 isoform X1 [Opisthocomus hoazin]|uniref:uncharacterized protein LOC142363815 isoform X1 n=1 Tax=Opisthocomus hoazin TaxID=30419 RepID=UPI003F535A55
MAPPRRPVCLQSAACSRARRQPSALKRESGSRAEPEPPEPSPASGCRVRASRDPRAGGTAGRPPAPRARPSGTRRPVGSSRDAVPPGDPPHHALSLGSAMSPLLLLLLVLLAAPGCAKPKRRPAARDAGADAEPAPAGKACANLTLVLDNWKFAITSQMRNLLLFDHQTVLPDYGRIRSLSGALDDLYRDFSALKEQLGRLSARFAELEAFVEQLSRGRGSGAPPRRRPLPPAPPQ